MLSEMQETWLWVGTAGMALGAGAIAVLGRRLRPEDRHHGVASFFVCLLAAAAYFAMANGQGMTVVDDRDVFWARYVDWVVTTPLLLLGLLLIALPPLKKAGEEVRDRNTLIASVIGFDVFMIVTGVIAALTADDTVKYVWFAISCGAFVAVLGLLWGPVRASAQAQGAGVASLFRTLATTLTVLWFIYPILWILGTEGTGTIDLTAEIFVFAVIDLTAKVAFGLMLVTGVRKLGAHAVARSSEPAVEAAAR